MKVTIDGSYVLIDGVRYVPEQPACENPGLLDLEWNFADGAGRMKVREYLCAILQRVWSQRDRFSGKRPFGDSGWEYYLYEVLIHEGMVDGQLDVYGRIDSHTFSKESRDEADEIISGLIAEMCGVSA